MIRMTVRNSDIFVAVFICMHILIHIKLYLNINVVLFMYKYLKSSLFMVK